MHLHPTWQKKIIGDFAVTFKSLQFIVTTHAPMVIGGLKNGAIFGLKDGNIFNLPRLYGKDANTILIEMDTQERLLEVKEKIDRYFTLIEIGEGKNKHAIELRNELENLMGKTDPELQKADMMLNFF